MVKHFVSVICEYNPFHFGHLYQLEVLKREFDGVVCIMSGDIVQRGSVAVAGKYLRAEAALRSGANLVLELPLPWCASSARDFARAGVHIASRIGSDSLAFGAEDGLDLLLSIDEYISNADFSKKLNTLVSERRNISYPMALAELVTEKLGAEAGKAVSKPNNILALEYLSALKHTSVTPYAVKRDMTLNSSSSIRALQDADRILNALPESSASVFIRSINVDFPRDASKLDAFFIGNLRRMKKCGSGQDVLYSLPDDLLKKIVAESDHASTVDELVSICTDKKYTSARIRRAILTAVFGINADRVKDDPPYTCVLASDSVGREILKQAKTDCGIDVITKPAHALSCGEKTVDAFLFSKSIEDVISLSAPTPSPADQGKTPLII